MQMLIQNAKLRDREELVNILIDGGKIVEIGAGLTAEAETVIDAEGNLTTASYIDPHIHLDKVNVLDVLPKNQSGTLKEAIEMLWDKKRNYVNEAILARGGDVVEREIKKGVLALKDKYKGVVDMQTVAFPQEGIVKDPGADKLMWQAMEMGCDVVGGMPANENCPDDSRAHVKLCFDIAEKYDADIDMHVDESDDPFYRTLEMVADETIARGWQGRVTAGHTCALAAYGDHCAAYVIEKVKKAGINVITNPVTNRMLQGRLDKQPIRRGITRVKELLAAGVTMSFGQDCVNDTFYPYGAGDMLQVALITGHAAQLSLPDEIEKTFDMITDDAARILRLENYGLKVGCDADIVITACHDARDAIRLTPERRYVIKRGRVVASTTVQSKLAIF